MRFKNIDAGSEWLEADGLGGFASGTVSTIRTRRYHGLLLAAERPPADRWLLVNGIEAWVERGTVSRALTTQRYADGVLHPDGASRIASFERDPWPTWTHALDPGSLTFELCVVRALPLTVLRWSPSSAMPGALLKVRLLVSGRDPHQLQQEWPDLRFALGVDEGRISLSTRPEVPRFWVFSNGIYEHAPDWYRGFDYTEEAARGLDHREDLASPGTFTFDLEGGPAVMLLSTDRDALGGPSERPQDVAKRMLAGERDRRRATDCPLERATQAYVVRRSEGKTVIAGYPWFGDWGRDTFIALRGLRHAADGAAVAEAILRKWAGAVSEGMLPNRFPDRGDDPEYNSVDASLWYVLAVRDHLFDGTAPSDVQAELKAAVHRILDGYAAGTRYGIGADESDGLLRAGVPGIQLTWMDAKVGDWVVTGRVGKPVEVQALWLNALAFGRGMSERFGELFERGCAMFIEKFYDPERGYLFDVVDCDGRPGATDDAFRPNQIFSLGGLPLALVGREISRSILNRLEDELWTPMGLRSLSPRHPSYVPRYVGGVWERDGAYHQGTVWPWLVGPFVDAWVWSHGSTETAQREARVRFLAPLLSHLDDAGLGHISEIADADAPHTPRGAPFQAWSLTEVLRLDRTLAR